MELMPGYKRSDFGVIPDDWDEKPLGEIGDSIIGLTYRPSEVRKYGTLVLRSSNVQNGTLCFDDNVFVDADIPDRIMVRPGDILVCVRNGSRDLIGKSALIDERAIGMTFGAFMAVFRSEHGKLLHHVFQSGIFKKQINQHLGATINQITNKSLNSFKVPLPPTDEERTEIANALSDVDALLATLDQVIAKKRDLKQAAMQQLLTGQTRLPGFSGEWLEKSLSKTATLKARIGWQGLTTAEYLDAGDYLLVTGTDFKNSNIDWQNCYYVTEERYDQDKYIQLQLNDVLVTKDGTIGKVALISELPNPATLNSGVFVIRPIKDAFHPSFFYFLLCSNIFTEFLNELCAGSTISHLYQKDFITFKYRTPPTLSEQAAIAKVLSDIDAELSVLEARRDKTRNIKQAMMQELLTGKTRLAHGELNG
jgi:type I restriction enzyme, S subunit